LAQRLGKTPIIIIEKLYEIDLVLQAAKKLNIKPIIGVRAKLHSQGIVRLVFSFFLSPFYLFVSFLFPYSYSFFVCLGSLGWFYW
jgi:hypothetical protein